MNRETFDRRQTINPSEIITIATVQIHGPSGVATIGQRKSICPWSVGRMTRPPLRSAIAAIAA